MENFSQLKELNKEIELCVKANSDMGLLSPKPGFLAIGETGLDFRCDASAGYIQIPWKNISRIECDVFGSYVRNIEVVTDQDQHLSFVLSKGAEVVRSCARHLSRDKLTTRQSKRKLATVISSFIKKLTGRGV